jgi:hypothetical protein
VQLHFTLGDRDRKKAHAEACAFGRVAGELESDLACNLQKAGFAGARDNTEG